MKPRTGPFLPDRPSVAEIAAGAVVVHRSSGEVLVLHDPQEDRWCFPKGHVEPGESIRAAAEREVREETGLREFRLEDELGESHYRFFDPSKARNVVKTAIYFLGSTVGRDVRLVSTFVEHRWVSAELARGLLG